MRENFEEKVKNNIWDTNFDEVVATIKELTTPGSTWHWSRNWYCKYVTIRVDMRDGGFILQNDKGRRINVEGLRRQSKDKEL